MTNLVAMPRDEGLRLDSAPPQPPPFQRSQLMAMGAENQDASSAGFDNPVVRAMAAMGGVKKGLQELAVHLPGLASGVQQMIAALEAAVPEQIAALMDGNPLGPTPGGAGY